RRSRRARSRSCGSEQVTRLTSFRNRGSTSLTLTWGCRLSLTAAPVSHGGDCILRAPGGREDLDRYTSAGNSRVDQVKRHVWAAVGEEPRALADDHREDEQVHLVDKVVV